MLWCVPTPESELGALQALAEIEQNKQDGVECRAVPSALEKLTEVTVSEAEPSKIEDLDGRDRGECCPGRLCIGWEGGKDDSKVCLSLQGCTLYY